MDLNSPIAQLQSSQRNYWLNYITMFRAKQFSYHVEPFVYPKALRFDRTIVATVSCWPNTLFLFVVYRGKRNEGRKESSFSAITTVSGAKIVTTKCTFYANIALLDCILHPTGIANIQRISGASRP